MMLYFSAYDKVHYSRWGSIYLSEMMQVDTTALYVYSEFMDGRFAVHTEASSFNGIILDFAVEHVNKIYKCPGSPTGITRSDSAFNMLCVHSAPFLENSEKGRDMLNLRIEDDVDAAAHILPTNKEAVAESLRDRCSAMEIFKTEQKTKL